MKTYAFMIAGVLMTSVATAQETVVTSAPTVEAAIVRSSSDLNATLTQLLNEAENQTEKLQTSLDRMGDPSAVNLASVQIIKNDIMQSTTALKTRDEQREMMTGLTGAEVFDNDALGLMEPIGATVTKEDGSIVDRDPEKYRMEAAMQAQVDEFNEVRRKALERKKMLLDEIKEVTQDMEEAKDLASIGKLQSMITLLYGQVEECNQSIAIAQGDVDMTMKELTNQAQVIVKGKQEEAYLKSQRPTTSGGAGAGATGSSSGTFRQVIPNLPWGRKADSGVDTGSAP